MKMCRKCHAEKPLSEFRKRAKASDGLDYYCKVCNNRRSLDWQKTTEAIEKRRVKNIEVYGITVQEYEDLLQKQQGVCAICDKPEKHFGRLVIDHCHETGKVRGLLCNHCNRGIGLLGDSVKNLLSSVRYLNGSK